MDLALPRLPRLGAAPPAVADDLSAPGSLGHDSRRWWALTVLLLAQLMIILDIVIVNVALPAAQRTLHIPPASVQWIVTAYLLPFGGLLLLGGRIADYTGRRRAFLICTVGFALASATGGAAQSEAMLFASRALQGLFAAAMAPALLSMLTLGFPSGRDRNIAFSLYTVVGASGGALGFILGGLLTQYLSWRWCLLINVPLSLLVLAAGGLLRESRATETHRYDVPGAVSATLGLLGLIYGISDAAAHGWGAARTLGPIIGGIAVLAGFLVWEGRAVNPLLPLALLRNRARGAGLLAISCVFGPPAGMLLVLLVFLEGPRRDSPLAAGLSFLPAPICAAIAAAIVLPLLGRVPWRALLAAGFALVAGGLLLATRFDVASSYTTGLVPVMALFGAGPAVLFLAGNTIALADAPADDSGVVGATINTVQQVSAALGASILATVAASTERHYLLQHGPASLPQALTHGDRVAFLVGGALTLAIGVACTLTMPATRGAQPSMRSAGH
jgi:MFS family permease